jgi:hypothetical protein
LREPPPAGKTFAGVIPSIVVYDVSTVAAAYSVAGFALDYKDIGAPAGTVSQIGLANTSLTAGNLVAPGCGRAYTTTPAVCGYGSGRSANGVVPQAEIYSLANSLAACVNSANSASSTNRPLKDTVSRVFGSVTGARTRTLRLERATC